MDEIEEIKQRIDIADLVGHYVTLKKAGANFKGLCPFHHERSPSFMVNPERQMFKCFGCQKGGDIFTFIQEIEHVEFGDALRMLADRANVTLTPRKQPKPGQAPSEKSRYYQINEAASLLFHHLLTGHSVGKTALEYLRDRKITDATIKEWRIGYAPRKKVLAELLLKKGFTREEIERAGKPDMFYERIIFPIFDVMGNVVGFTGRILGQGEPKYLNTPETPIFHKSRILFGLEKAKKAIKETKRVILSEGQMDVIGAHQAGTENVVATSGTALTQDHLRILSRYEADIVFAFDADSAGQAATKKAIEMAAADQLPIKIIPIPAPYKDIGDIVEKQPDLWRELSAKPVPAIQWQIETVLSKYRHKNIERKLSIDEKKRVAKEVVPVLVQISDPIEQAHYMQLLAKRLEVKEDIIQQAMNQLKPKDSRFAGKTAPIETVRERRQLSTEETLLGLLELTPALKTQHADLYNELKAWYTQSIQDLTFLVQEQYRGLSPAEVQAEIVLLIARYTEHKRDSLKADFAVRIRDAEQSGDREQVKKLLAEFQHLIKPSN
jgi:DNA primase